MRIVYIVAFPFVIAIAVLLYLIYMNDRVDLALWLLVPVVSLAVIYVSQSQIMWFFAKNSPPELNETDRSIIENNSVLYSSLSEEDKKTFEDRISLILLTRNFQYQHSEVKDIPRDIKIRICLPLVHYSWKDEYFFEDDYQYVVMYPHPFLSPAYPDTIHISETEHKDGVLIFSFEQLIPGFRKKSVNLAAYEWAQAYMYYRNINFDSEETSVENAVSACLKISMEQLHKLFNLEEINYDALAYALYHEFPEETESLIPEEFRFLNFNGIEKI